MKYLIALLLVLGLTSADFARGLAAGMSLKYDSGTADDFPWRVDTVQFGLSIGGRTDVTRMVLKLRPDAPASVRTYAIAGDTLLTFDGPRGWRPQRPLVPHRVLVMPGTGDTTRVTTGDTATMVVGGKKILTLRTSYVFQNRSGRVIRRLTEDYAPSLATAVTGLFEVPDSLTGSWRTATKFRLVEVK